MSHPVTTHEFGESTLPDDVTYELEADVGEDREIKQPNTEPND